MKASELRIGNITQDKISKKKYFITANSLRYLIESEADKLDVSIEPIPLTEEWLLKFGFDNVRKNMLVCHNEYHNNRINEGAFYVEPVGDAFNHWYLYHKVKMITSNIRFVHQLQNLYFALCGEELELK